MAKHSTSVAQHRKSVRTSAFAIAGLALTVATLIVAWNASPYRVFAVRTDSMVPTIPPRSAVIVREHDYKLGQVISFREAGVVMTHRLVAINADGTLTTKGDDNKTVDPWRVQPGAVIGGVVAAPRMLGYWLYYFRNPVGLLSILFSWLAVAQIVGLRHRYTPEALVMTRASVEDPTPRLLLTTTTATTGPGSRSARHARPHAAARRYRPRTTRPGRASVSSPPTTTSSPRTSVAT